MDKNIKNIIGSLVAVGFSGTEYNKHIKKIRKGNCIIV